MLGCWPHQRSRAPGLPDEGVPKGTLRTARQGEAVRQPFQTLEQRLLDEPAQTKEGPEGPSAETALLVTSLFAATARHEGQRCEAKTQQCQRARLRDGPESLVAVRLEHRVGREHRVAGER